MNWIVFHIASGDSFFSGLGLIIVAVLVENWQAAKRSRLTTQITGIGLLLGVILMVISSNPSTIVCMVAVLFKAILQSTWEVNRSRLRWITILVLVCQLGWQASYLIGARVNTEKFRYLLVIGDSIAAGMNESQSSKWSSIVAEKSNLEHLDSARPGATTTDIVPLLERTAKANIAGKTIVIVEIGGNDLLQGRTVTSYRRGLESILGILQNRAFETIYMFELPLPPFHERFAFWQRSLARKYNVRLIPKREFLSVIAAQDSTSDSLHLSTLGHRRMAAKLTRYLTRNKH